MLWEWRPPRDEAPAVTAVPTLLYLAHRVPYPPDKGDRIRNFHVLKAVARRAAVHLACLADEPVRDEDVAALRRHCARLAIVPVRRASRWVRAAAALALGGTATQGAFASPVLHALVRGWAGATRYRAALASTSSLAPYLCVPELRGVPAVVDLVDVDSQKWLDYATASRGPRAWAYRTEGQRLRRLEADLPSWARAVTLVSDAEAALYRRFAAPGRVAAVTNGVDLEYFAPAAGGDGPPSCAFVGALDYRPNVDGACWFCAEVWPEVRRRHPRAVLRLVGRHPVPAVRELAKLPGVEVVGPVPDVRPYVAAATAVVVPLRIARGVPNKLLEALAMGKAVVASPPSLAAFRLRPGTELLCASAPAEWAAALDRVFGDPALRRALGSAGRLYAEGHHRWDRCLEPFAELLGLAGEAAATPPGPVGVGG